MSKRSRQTEYEKYLVDVTGDGSCYYRALYGALIFSRAGINVRNELKKIQCNVNENSTRSDIILHEKIKLKLYKQLHNYDEEEIWVDCLRNVVSNLVLYPYNETNYPANDDSNLLHKTVHKQVSDMISDSYNVLLEAGPSLSEILEEFPSELRSKLRKGPPEDLPSFRKLLSDHIKNKSHYAGEYDCKIVAIIFELLFGIEIVIKTINNDIKTNDDVRATLALFPDTPQHRTIYLLNINTKHYNFVEYDEDAGATKMLRALYGTQGGKKVNMRKILVAGRLYKKKPRNV